MSHEKLLEEFCLKFKCSIEHLARENIADPREYNVIRIDSENLIDLAKYAMVGVTEVKLNADTHKHSHYKKNVAHLTFIDVYRVLQLFEVVDPAIQHAIKKLLVPGRRGGGKNLEQDYREAVDSINRALQMIAEDDSLNLFARP